MFYVLNPGYAEGVVKQRTTHLTARLDEPFGQGRAGLHISKPVPAWSATAGIVRKVWVKMSKLYHIQQSTWQILSYYSVLRLL